MFTDKQVSELIDILVKVSKESKIYLGCDSIRFMKGGKKFAKYAAVAIVHIDGKHGCKIFSNVSVEPDYDLKKNRPKIRMLTEVRKVCELYTQLAPFIDEFNVEIHLDISEDPKNGSNCAATEAAGYVLGVTGLEPKLKPHSFASSFGADHIVNHAGSVMERMQ